jgi:hypothetical protein
MMQSQLRELSEVKRQWFDRVNAGEAELLQAAEELRAVEVQKR